MQPMLRLKLGLTVWTGFKRSCCIGSMTRSVNSIHIHTEDLFLYVLGILQCHLYLYVRCTCSSEVGIAVGALLNKLSVYYVSSLVSQPVPSYY